MNENKVTREKWHNRVPIKQVNRAIVRKTKTTFISEWPQACLQELCISF